LNIDDLTVTNLYDEARDGLLLLKVIHKIDPTVVDWKKVDKNPNNKFKQGINCNVAIEACKKLNIHLPGIGGTDILEGNKPRVIAVVW
jgi:translation elongation factor EF-4